MHCMNTNVKIRWLHTWSIGSAHWTKFVLVRTLWICVWLIVASYQPHPDCYCTLCTNELTYHAGTTLYSWLSKMQVQLTVWGINEELWSEVKTASHTRPLAIKDIVHEVKLQKSQAGLWTCSSICTQSLTWNTRSSSTYWDTYSRSWLYHKLGVFNYSPVSHQCNHLQREQHLHPG